MIFSLVNWIIYIYFNFILWVILFLPNYPRLCFFESNCKYYVSHTRALFTRALFSLVWILESVREIK